MRAWPKTLGVVVEGAAQGWGLLALRLGPGGDWDPEEKDVCAVSPGVLKEREIFLIVPSLCSPLPPPVELKSSSPGRGISFETVRMASVYFSAK